MFNSYCFVHIIVTAGKSRETSSLQSLAWETDSELSSLKYGMQIFSSRLLSDYILYKNRSRLIEILP